MDVVVLNFAVFLFLRIFAKNRVLALKNWVNKGRNPPPIFSLF